MSDTPSSPSATPPETKSAPRGLLYGVAALVAIGLGASVVLLKKSSTPEPAPASTPTTSAAVDLTVDESGLSKAVATIETPKGNISFRFYTNDAPKTVARIVELIQSGFYDGLIFHRVVPDFVIQGGDPQGNGTGGSGQKLEAEFNSRNHVEGTLAMARAQDPNSADSQFYIALGPIPHLDGSYTIFGQVSEGLDVVKKIEINDPMTRVWVR